MEDKPDPWTVAKGIDEWAFIPGDSNPKPGIDKIWDRSKKLWVDREEEKVFQLPENEYVVDGAEDFAITQPGDPTALTYLSAAKDLVELRGEIHGEKGANHRNIATEWTHYLALYKGVYVDITPADVAMMMARLKDARTLTGAYNPDDDVDSIAYRAIVAEFRK